MDTTDLTIKPDVLNYDDIRQMVPFFDGKPRLVSFLMKLLAVDKVNWIHRHNCHTPGVPFVQGLLNDLQAKIIVHGEEVLKNLPQDGFITVSNHPFGALDGIMLIKLVGEQRPDFKVMVNMVLNHISAMRPNFIAVDALASDDPQKRAVSVRGIASAMRHVREGHPLGFFPAGAVSKFTRDLHIEDRQWQPSVVSIIRKLKVPVIPIYFHGHNSPWFTILGMIDWRLRTLRLPAEVFRRKGDTFRVSVGRPIMPEVQAQYESVDALGQFLKQQTYAMKLWKK
ncbi:MAG: lysophospholipid acyltransferase family protein [Muribaculaceae bacterium]|nr:lysophospholipid acyltransferase family protein [Muribaculaceae bacterium]